MIPWALLDTARLPDDKTELRLKRRGTEFSIMLGSNELMNSRLSGSERELARLSCERMGGRDRPRILIGGLGMGFTLRAAQSLLPPRADIVVAELVPAVVRWARGPMSEIFGDSLDDPRVTIHEGDVGAVIAAARQSFDAILLDVDNGPEGLSTAANDALYSHTGLARARIALKPSGILAVWSAGPNQAFAQRLRQTGLVVEEVRTRANGRGGGARHMIWIATKRS